MKFKMMTKTDQSPSRARVRVGLVAIAASAVLVAAGCSSQSAEPSSQESLDASTSSALDSALKSSQQQLGFPGVIAGVWVGDQQWVGTLGTAEKGTETALTTDDHTRIGSITKTFTGTVVLQLVESGKLSLDTVIEEYVPGMPNGKKATIRNLLEMQSGIPTYTMNTTVVNEWAATPTQVFTPQQLVDSVKAEKPDFAPGTQMEYSNTNFVLLGMVITKVTGKSVSDVFQEQILTPLKLDQTSVPGDSAAIPSPWLSGISTQANPLGVEKNATTWTPTFASTAGDMISTLDNLHRWSVALATGEGILKPETQQMRLDALKTTVKPNSATRSYGMGMVNTDGWIGHVGDIPGYNTVINYDPTTRTTIVVMVNSDIEANGMAPAVGVFQSLAEVMSNDASPKATSTS
ncbi:MAG: serine hydrolase domain-containing protein [Candidatus Nanopelagicales bacterium]